MFKHTYPYPHTYSDDLIEENLLREIKKNWPDKIGSKWDQLVPGGAYLIHDYKCSLFPGVYKATNEFCKNKGLTPFVCADSQSSAIIYKSLKE